MAFKTVTRSREKKSLSPTKIVRCAVYTRKSTVEGLDSEFSTLDAQREACEAYIVSQRLEGWQALSDRYDDGGFTGGSIERPALQQLLADIRNGLIDCVVVYKVDRLSRSLFDFAKLMEVFDLHQVAFVSVTQQFNTSTSMGRLVLNVLLSFAQFEREIISERTSDKLCAARLKGKMLGGPPVLGYDIDRDRKRLKLNLREVPLVKSLFDLYLKKRSLLEVAIEANRRGWKTKSHVTKSGKRRVGHNFAKTDVYRILTNVTYIGKINHKGKIVQGEQPPIIDKATFENAQRLIKHNRHAGGKPYRHQHNALLKKLLHCGKCGAAMGHTYTIKSKNRLYRYYLCTTRHKQGDEACNTARLPAQEIEDCVVEMIKRIGQDRTLSEQAFAEAVARRNVQIAELTTELQKLRRRMKKEEDRIAKLVAIIETSYKPLDNMLARLNQAEEALRQTKHRVEEIETQLEVLDSEAVERDHLLDALSRLGLLWDTLAERERMVLIRQVLEAVTYDQSKEKLTLVFRLVP
jgi:site-specific DNA recombinase